MCAQARPSFLLPSLLLQVNDYRAQFSKWWQSEFKAVTFPGEVRPR